jgi:hypothetical protein
VGLGVGLSKISHVLAGFSESEVDEVLNGPFGHRLDVMQKWVDDIYEHIRRLGSAMFIYPNLVIGED